ncbi:MAG: polysaccharide biosynthesis/export family protein [Flavobacteriales bacterium]
MIVLQSCIPVRNLKPFIEEEGVVLTDEGYIETNKKPYKVKIDDEIKVKILTEDPNIAKYLGIEFVDKGVDNPLVGTESFTGRVVDREGYINIPRLGELYVKGKTFDEIRDLIKNSLKKLYKGDLNVKVGLVRYEFYITGEAGVSNRFSSYKQLNLMEALAMSGTMPLTADRSSIRVFKKQDNGYRLVKLDLNQMSTINLTEFYVDNNDIIQVDPIKTKTLGTGTSGLQTILTITSFITSMATFYIFLQNL